MPSQPESVTKTIGDMRVSTYFDYAGTEIVFSERGNRQKNKFKIQNVDVEGFFDFLEDITQELPNAPEHECRVCGQTYEGEVPDKCGCGNKDFVLTEDTVKDFNFGDLTVSLLPDEDGIQMVIEGRTGRKMIFSDLGRQWNKIEKYAEQAVSEMKNYYDEAEDQEAAEESRDYPRRVERLWELLKDMGDGPHEIQKVMERAKEEIDSIEDDEDAEEVVKKIKVRGKAYEPEQGHLAPL